MKITRVLVSLSAFALAAFPLLGQSNAERVTNNAYARSHDYDLVHQRIELRDFNWDSTSFLGRVVTTLIALRPGLDSITLNAGHLLEITAVTDAKGAALRHVSRGDSLVVFPAHPVPFHDSIRFTIAYRGKVENGRGLTFLDTEGRAHRPRQLWSQGEAMDNHFWFPTYDFPNDKMTWELVATVPAQYTVVSNGRLVSNVKGPGGTRTFDWKQERPSATYLVSIVVAPLVKIHDSWKGVPVDYYVYRDDSALARPLFRVTPDMIDVYSTLTGVPYAWQQYAQTTVADFFGGMENVSATTLVDWLPDQRGYLDRPWYQYILIPHELAHQWFGDYTTTENWANTWLNEGFAEYMPGQYWRVKLGRHAEDDYYLDEYRQFMAIDAQHSMPVAADESNNIYPKGALVLRMLERYLGEQRFWASIHRYLTSHAYGNATTDDLRQAVLEATGENMSWFWDEWLYQAGYPRFTVTSRYDPGAKQLTLSVKQTQQGKVDTATDGRVKFTTPTVFRMPVTIRIGTASGDVVHRAQIDSAEQQITIGGVASEPTMVVFDDGNTILKQLTFEEPTPQLAMQLERDPDLWNRQWVIGQLEQRSSDAAAGAALARAASSADYYLTRAAAAEALGHFPSAVALAPLERAAGDSSAAVRAAAVTALGTVGGGEALRVARDALGKNASYQVRAAAVGTVARLDSAGRDAVLAAALAAPSYRDAIQTAALQSIVELGDTAAIARLDASLGEQRATYQVLAALAARGSVHALDVLANHLDDDRAYVRRAVVRALRQVPPALSSDRLRALLPTLKHTDAREGVEALLQRK